MNITSKDIIRIEIPGLKTVSEANAHEHWRKRQVRAKAQRQSAFMHTHGHVRSDVSPLPATVTLTRLGPRKLDSDNCAGAMKHVRDGVADAIGVDDGDEGYDWQYRQEKSKTYGVRIEIQTKAPVDEQIEKPSTTSVMRKGDEHTNGK